jgi:hypothetical protein
MQDNKKSDGVYGLLFLVYGSLTRKASEPFESLLMIKYERGFLWSLWPALIVTIIKIRVLFRQ